MPQIDSYLRLVRQHSGSDLHISSLEIPKIRIHGRLTPLKESTVPPERMAELIDEVLDDRRRKIYRTRNDLDMAYELPGVARFRVNIFRTRKGPAAVFRLIPEEITPLAELGVPMTVLKYAQLKNGLVLVTGPTGSGKSTTLAAILDYVNVNMKRHIITIEEPIEFVHKNKKSFFLQREVGVDTDSFAAALRACPREDPDVILVGELRDPETISLAITAAEMGYLVFATLHTNSAAKTVDRIINVFPEEQQNQIRVMLSVTLKGVCAQQLLPRTDGKGRVPVNELLFWSSGLGNNIREGSISKIISLIETGRGDGMQLMDDSILAHYNDGSISGDTAYLYAHQKQRFQHLAPKSA